MTPPNWKGLNELCCSEFCRLIYLTNYKIITFDFIRKRSCSSGVQDKRIVHDTGTAKSLFDKVCKPLQLVQCVVLSRKEIFIWISSALELLYTLRYGFQVFISTQSMPPEHGSEVVNRTCFRQSISSPRRRMILASPYLNNFFSVLHKSHGNLLKEGLLTSSRVSILQHNTHSQETDDHPNI